MPTSKPSALKNIFTNKEKRSFLPPTGNKSPRKNMWDTKSDLKKQRFINFANDHGFRGVISRQEIWWLVNKYELPFPAWLVSKENGFRVGLAVFQLPTIDYLKRRKLFPHLSKDRSDEVSYVFLKLKYDIDKITKISRLDEVLQVSKLHKNAGINLEKRVLSLRYGIEGGITKTLEEVAKELGLSRQRIFQLEQKALQRLERYTGKTMNLTLTENSRQKY